MSIHINLDNLGSQDFNITITKNNVPLWVYNNSQTEQELKRMRIIQHQKQIQKEEELQQRRQIQLRLQRERDAKRKEKQEQERKNKRKLQTNAKYSKSHQLPKSKQDDGPEL